jgi:phytoene synthase
MADTLSTPTNASRRATIASPPVTVHPTGQSDPDAAELEALVAFSRERIEKGSKSFAGAARLFDEETRASAYMLYAWCRHADDEIDGQDLGFMVLSEDEETAEHRLERLIADTENALHGKADKPVFKALSYVVAKHEIPHRHPMELIDGFRMDVDEHTYRSIDDTLVYCYHVAGVVGVMMAMIMGVRDRETLNRASDLGIAFQLTNIARDIIPDAEMGRVYLPADWLAEAGIAPDAVADPTNRAAVFRVAERLLDTADRYYDSACVGIAELPPRAAWSIAAARNVYRDIGNVVRARGANAWDTRAYTGKARKLVGVALGGAQALAAKTIGRRVSADAVARRGLWTHPGLGS